MTKLNLVLESVRDEFLANSLEESDSEVTILKRKHFLNENINFMKKILVEENILGNARDSLANSWAGRNALGIGAGAGLIGGIGAATGAYDDSAFEDYKSAVEKGLGLGTMANQNLADQKTIGDLNNYKSAVEKGLGTMANQNLADQKTIGDLNSNINMYQDTIMSQANKLFDSPEFNAKWDNLSPDNKKLFNELGAKHGGMPGKLGYAYHLIGNPGK